MNTGYIPYFLSSSITLLSLSVSRSLYTYTLPISIHQSVNLSIYLSIYLLDSIPQSLCPVGWGSTIHRLQRCKTPPMRVLDLTLNNLIVRFQ